MEVNFFGLMYVTRKALKVMREVNKPAGGKIQQVTSIGGQVAFPTTSIYCASKWAVEGLTESISQEMKPEWNIKLTCIEPGGFRTDWAGRSMVFGDEKEAAYDHIDAEKAMNKANGTQRGDPVKGGRAMWELGKTTVERSQSGSLADNPSLHSQNGRPTSSNSHWIGCARNRPRQA